MLRNKRIPYLHLLPIIFITLVLYKLVETPKIILDTTSYIFSILSYLIWGVVISYLLNPLLNYLEKKFKLKRIWSLSIVYLLFTALVVFIIAIIAPVLVSNISILLNTLPKYVNQSETWIIETLHEIQKHDRFNTLAINVLSYFEDNITTLVSQLNRYIEATLNFFIRKMVSVTTTIIKLVFGVLISIYILKDKDSLIEYIKRFFHAYLPDKKALIIIDIFRKFYFAFTQFISGKLLASTIIGFMCFMGLIFFQLPFALLLSIVVGITNMVPYIGSAFGMIPAVFVAFFISPMRAFWVLVFLLAIQQFDAWYLSPKIIGDQIGLSPLLIITSIIVGGALYGIPGILISIPIAAVIKQLLNESINKRLELKNSTEE